MKILAVETATARQSVAILEDDTILAQREQEAGGAHGTLLLPAIDLLLTQCGLSLGELSGLACSVGPGSFTGIRVGMATCLGLRAATGLPLVLVPTLEAMVWHARTTSLPICPVLTSRKGEVFWAIFRWTEEGRFNRVLSEQVGTPSHLARSLTEHTMIYGGGWVAMESEIRAAVSASVRITVGPDPSAMPSAVYVGQIGLKRLRQGEIAGDVVTPLYVQRAEAEVQYDQAGGVSPVVRRQKRVEKKITERLARGRGRRAQ